MSDKAVLFAVSLLVIIFACLMMVMWRLRKNAAQKAEAERRMGAALEELNRLTARLRSEQIKRDAHPTPDSTASIDAANPEAKESIIWRENV